MICPDCGTTNHDTAYDCHLCGTVLRLHAQGTVLGGRYRVETRLGAGGMGVVYRAWDTRLESRCALKELTLRADTESARADLLARFKSEAQLLRRLAHPGLPRVYDLFDENGKHFLVQDFIEGEDLAVLLEREGRPGLPEEQVRALAVELLDIVAYLHDQSPAVLHRDVKPSNLMRRAGSGRLVLVDFGIARDARQSTGTPIGTASYCAPEQWTGRAVPASDLYSVGATMYHLLTGELPIPLQCEAPPVGSPHIRAVISKAVDPKISQRYGSAREMAGDLGGRAGAVDGTPGDTPSRSRAAVSGEDTVVQGRAMSAEETAKRAGAGVPSVAREGERTASPSARASRRGPGFALATALSVALLAVGRWGWLAASAPPHTPAPVSSPAVSPEAVANAELVSGKDGTVLVLVQGDTYTIGSNDDDTDARPKCTVHLKGYAIGKHEVTNAQYDRFVQATGHKSGGDWKAGLTKWGYQAPVVNVSWNDASAYCAWAGLRLPTEAEWEAAARGKDARMYVWGATWDPSWSCNSVGKAADGPAAVGAYPKDVSPFGCLDMEGNVSEWCHSHYLSYPYDPWDGREALAGTDDRVFRGGAWNDDGLARFHTVYRDGKSPSFTSPDLGFRCAKSL